MRRIKVFVLVLLISLISLSCTKEVEEEKKSKGEEVRNEEEIVYVTSSSDNKRVLTNPDGEDIVTRILTPEGFNRVDVVENTFGEYLRHLPLKPEGSPVLHYDGREKGNRSVYMAVVDMDIGNRDLQQCADAIMRLRGEYLYGQGLFDQIHFNFTNGFQADYSKWCEGYRIEVQGNKVLWVKKTTPANTYESFRAYMNIVFAYAGTLSLSAELETTSVEEMEIGDIFIQGGSPGHAIIVVDMAVHEESGEKLFLLAQSYMPAQDIHILVNPESSISPWYSAGFGETLITPEWKFKRSDIKRFK